MTSQQALVAVILVNWNGRQDTLACLDSLRQVDYPALKIILVDNASTDGLVAVVNADYPEVELIVSPTNEGFVGGNNLGMARADAIGADYILLLNNDTEVAPDFLGRLVEAAQQPGIGIVGPLIYYHGEPRRIWSAGGRIDWGRGDPIALGEDAWDEGQFGDSPYVVDYVSGCALMIKRETLKAVGPLDPRFFAYYEEVEWCARVGRAGYRILVVPQSRIWHKITREARFASANVGYYMTRNRLLFLKLSRARLTAWANTLLLQTGRTILAYTVLPKWRYKADARQAMIDGVMDFFKGRFGARPRVVTTT